MTTRPLRDAVAGWVHARLLAAPATGARRRALARLRALLAAHGDPPVRFQLAGMTLLVPISHDLPMLRKRFPLYSENLARLTGAVAAKYPDLAAVDIGANVGDSVALIRSAAPVPVLCVEGDARYLEYLRANTAALANVSIAPVFVAASTGELPASFEAARGTGHLEVGGAGNGLSVATASLDALVAEYPLSGRFKLLKSDTDGFEAVILTAARATLEAYRPVLVFEYDPGLLGANGIGGLDLLRSLHEAGYAWALMYDNFGDLVLGAALDDRRHLEELHGYVSGRRSELYLDVAAFHQDDADLFQAFRDSELDFFRTVRHGDGP